LESLALLIAALIFFAGALLILFKSEIKLSRSYEQKFANRGKVPSPESQAKEKLAEDSSNLTINFITIHLDEKVDEKTTYPRRIFPKKGVDDLF